MTTTSTRPDIRSLLGRGITYILAKPIEPKRPVTGCDDCDNGCMCEGGIEGIGCRHWACWGRAATFDADLACPSVAAHRDHMHAYAEYRKALYAYDQQSHLR